jgi:hypothetical protein
MSDATTGPSARSPHPPEDVPHRSWIRVPRRRRGELFLATACAVALPVSLLVAAGFVPGVFPSSPIRFTQQVVACSLNSTGSVVDHELPAWATVSVRWVVQSPAGADVLYEVDRAGIVALFQLGNNGTGSFQSQGGSYEFQASFAFFPNGATGCQTVVIAITAAYTLL